MEQGATVWFGSTCFWARTLGFQKVRWEDADAATNAYFRPIETFEARFDELLTAIRQMGYDAVDLWGAQLNGAWATPEHLTIANELLGRHAVRVGMLMGELVTLKDGERACDVATAIGASSIGGDIGGDMPIYQEHPTLVASIAQRHGLRVALENHPETAEDILRQIERSNEDAVVGTTLDIGNYSAARYDPLRAIDVLEGHIVRVHLKDLPSAEAYGTCAGGEGIVPVEACVARLRHHASYGGLTVDHETYGYDPSDECRHMLVQAKSWLDD